MLLLTAIFLIVLVLIQRGKGGGLAGAFGGMGGQSAFGTKAGDLFTRITMVVAGIWIVLCIVAVKVRCGASLARWSDVAPAPGAPASPTNPPRPAREPAPAGKPGRASDAGDRVGSCAVERQRPPWPR